MAKIRTPRAWKRPDVAPVSSLEERTAQPEIGPSNVSVPVGERNTYTGGTPDRVSDAARSRGSIEYIRLRMVEKALGRRNILVPPGTSYVAAVAMLDADKARRANARAARIASRANRKVRGPVNAATRKTRILAALTCLFPNCGQQRNAEVHITGQHQFLYKAPTVTA